MKFPKRIISSIMEREDRGLVAPLSVELLIPISRRGEPQEGFSPRKHFDSMVWHWPGGGDS